MSITKAALRKQAVRVVAAADKAGEIDAQLFTLKVARARIGGWQAICDGSISLTCLFIAQ